MLKNSRISDHTAPSFETRGKCYFQLRNRLIEDGIIVDGVFQTNHEFTSPSAASAIWIGIVRYKQRKMGKMVDTPPQSTTKE